MRTEEWRTVGGYEGLYEVSNLGNVRRIGRAKGATTGALLRQSMLRHGYLRVTLYADTVRRDHTVHRLVAMAFLGAPPDVTHEVNHRDANKANNRADNLEWVPHIENMRHAFRLGLINRLSMKSPRYKLTPEAVAIIRSCSTPTETLAAKFNVSAFTITSVRNRSTWKHIA